MWDFDRIPNRWEGELDIDYRDEWLAAVAGIRPNISGSDSSHATSVLIIQQHSLKGELDGVDDEFSIM
jgi:hypothetical protein